MRHVVTQTQTRKSHTQTHVRTPCTHMHIHASERMRLDTVADSSKRATEEYRRCPPANLCFTVCMCTCMHGMQAQRAVSQRFVLAGPPAVQDAVWRRRASAPAWSGSPPCTCEWVKPSVLRCPSMGPYGGRLRSASHESVNSTHNSKRVFVPTWACDVSQCQILTSRHFLSKWRKIWI